MTCVIAIKHEDKIYMGADSLISDGNQIGHIPAAPPKLMKINNFLLGFAGTTQMQNFLMVTPNFLSNFTTEEDAAELLKSEMNVKNAKNDLILLSGGQSIIFISSNGWYIFNDYYAIGTGYQVALGALHATKLVSNINDRLNSVLEAAEAHAISVRKPFIIESI